MKTVIAQLEFDAGTFDRVLAAFLSLPEPLRPQSFGEDEEPANSIMKPINDRERFATFVEKNRGLGFVLFAPAITYGISCSRQGLVSYNELKIEPAFVEQFLIHMAAAQPVFGFACMQEERYQRNRVTTTQGINTIESWVGRDPQKYVPGFYWLTLLPEALAAKHGVPLAAVERVAQEHIELEGRQHLFRFYERPGDWQATPAVARLCASLPGVFDVENVKQQLAAAKSFLGLQAVTKNWR